MRQPLAHLTCVVICPYCDLAQWLQAGQLGKEVLGMPAEKSYHMTPEEFREAGRAVVDWIADYYERIESFPVLSQVEPGQIRDSLPAAPPGP